jgi:hypothetical protein
MLLPGGPCFPNSTLHPHPPGPWLLRKLNVSMEMVLFCASVPQNLSVPGQMMSFETSGSLCSMC